MKIGLISDTHGNFQRTTVAIAKFKARGVSAVIHCGDVGAAAILTHLVDVFDPLRVPVYVVLGNVDLYDEAMEQFPERPGLRLLGRVGDLDLAGKRIAVIHGDDTRALREATAGGGYDYVFTGHTHRATDEQSGGTRVINPGAVHRAVEPSCAVLDLSSGALELIPLS